MGGWFINSVLRLCFCNAFELSLSITDNDRKCDIKFREKLSNDTAVKILRFFAAMIYELQVK